MLSNVAYSIAHCKVCIDPKKAALAEKDTISNLIIIIKSMNEFDLLHS